MKNKIQEKFYQVKSIISNDVYWTSTRLEEKRKYIESGWFLAVKRKKEDKNYFFIREDSIVKV